MICLGLIGGEQLGHGGLARHPCCAHVLGPGGAIDQQGGGIYLKRHVGDMALHHLQVKERCALHFACACTRAKASSSARRAKPRAAAATVVRNMSNTDMAILNPCPGCTQQGARAAPGNPSKDEPSPRGEAPSPPTARPRLKTRQYRQAPERPKAPVAPGASPVRAKTRVDIGDAAVGNPGLSHHSEHNHRRQRRLSWWNWQHQSPDCGSVSAKAEIASTRARQGQPV